MTVGKKTPALMSNIYLGASLLIKMYELFSTVERITMAVSAEVSVHTHLKSLCLFQKRKLFIRNLNQSHYGLRFSL